MACCTSLPYFVTSDRELYAVNSESDELFMYDSEDDDEHVLRKCWMLLTDPQTVSDAEDRTVSLSTALCSRDTGRETDTCPLLNDCMWSAGMLPPDLKPATPTTRPSRDCVSVTAAEDVDVDSAVVSTAVDPSLISPCPHVSHQQPQPLTVMSSPGARHVTSFTDTGMQTRAFLMILACIEPRILEMYSMRLQEPAGCNSGGGGGLPRV